MDLLMATNFDFVSVGILIGFYVSAFVGYFSG